jgi:O-phosphoseryl-tRNA synthetase
LVKLEPNEILKRVKKEGYEKVWRESANLLPEPKKRLELVIGKRGQPHPLFDLIQKLRQFFLNIGFMEVSNPVIVEEAEVYKQYGPEAPVILDRCYYLATLPRPDIGLSKAKCLEIERLKVKLTDERTAALQRVLRNYKKGDVASDDFVEKIAEALNVSDSTATLLLSEAFPEFAALKPQSSTLTLRSHMTSAWFLTLQTLQHKLELPIKLFSVGIRFRREQSEDSTHLRTHHVASCVIMDEELNVKDGEEITKAMLKPFGFERFRFVQKKVTSKYYTPGTEYEGYIFHPGMSEWIEIVDYGLYSPIALANYDIECLVFNLGMGVERVASVLYGENDVRRLVYPQFYADLALSDAEIAKMVKVEVEPQSETGIKIRDAIKSTALKYAKESSPCEFLAYEGRISGKKARVYVYETDVGTKLLGPAAFNSIYIYDGNILGIPKKGIEHMSIVKEAREKGIPLGFSYLDAVASLAAAKIEEAVHLGQGSVNARVKMAKHPSDVNIKVSDVARRYITNNKKKIEVTGPVFIGVRAEIAS